MTTDGWSDEGPPWARAPKDWPAVSAAAVHDAIDRVLLILVDQRQVAIERLDDFVGQGGDRSSLLRLPREAPDDVAAVDLLAVSHAVGRLDARSLSRVLHRGAYHELLLTRSGRYPRPAWRWWTTRACGRWNGRSRRRS